MTDVLDSCCVSLQMTKIDKNNNHTTTHINAEVDLPSEQCDNSQNKTNDESRDANPTDDHQHSTNDDTSNTDTNVTPSSTDENDASINVKSSVDTTNLYKDFSGIDTESFITTTLRNNPKDRILLLTLEKIFQQFIQNQEQTSYQFQAMNSYERMIVHRVAAFFGLDHNVDKHGQSITVTKTINTRIPNISFQNFIPTDELSNDIISALNASIENSTFYNFRRNGNNFHQQTFKPSFEHHVESAHRIPNQSFYKINRKQQRFNTNHHVQSTDIQSLTQMINPQIQPIYPPSFSSYYSQQSTIDRDIKQQTSNSPAYNYVPMISSTSLHGGNSIPLPILLHQQSTGQIQYVFPTHSLQQIPRVSFDGQYLPVYQSDVIRPIIDNKTHFQPPFVHVYPTYHYSQAQPTTYIQSVPSFMIPSNNPTSIQYTTNQLATLNLQSQHDSSRFLPLNNLIKPIVQSSTRMANYRQSRPLNTNQTDKQATPIESNLKSLINNDSDQVSLTESAQDND